MFTLYDIIKNKATVLNIQKLVVAKKIYKKENLYIFKTINEVFYGRKQTSNEDKKTYFKSIYGTFGGKRF